MPYTKQERRKPFEKPIRDAELALAKGGADPGDLNYFISSVLDRFTMMRGKKYLTICIVMGTLICVAFEYYRRVAAGYEDQKKRENTDVYDKDLV